MAASTFAVALWADAATARYDQVECSKIALRFDDAKYTTICYTGTVEQMSDSGEEFRFDYEELVAYGKGYEYEGTAQLLRLARYRSFAGTIIHRISVERYVSELPWLVSTRNWEPELEIEGYRVQLVEARRPGMGGYDTCAGLVRQEGGLRGDLEMFTQMVGGFFCYPTGGDDLIAHLKPFLASIRY